MMIEMEFALAFRMNQQISSLGEMDYDVVFKHYKKLEKLLMEIEKANNKGKRR